MIKTRKATPFLDPTYRETENPETRTKGITRRAKPDAEPSQNKHLTEAQERAMRIHGIGLKEICEWWIQAYPEDIFVGKTPGVKLIVEIRERMIKILELGK